VSVPELWISIIGIAFIFFLCTSSILWSERRSRYLNQLLLSTQPPPLKRWSMRCIMIGPIHGAAVMLQYLNGTCYFAWYIGDVCVVAQMLSMGFYQLARLRLLNSSILKIAPGLEGKFVTKMQLRVLWSVGCGLLLFMFPTQLLGRYSLRSSCGIDLAQGMLFRAEHTLVVPPELMDKVNIVFLIVCLLWDAAIVLLFVVQIIRITGIETEIATMRAHFLTRHAMYRVLVCSIFYGLVLFTAFVLRNWRSGNPSWALAIDNLVDLPVALTLSLSMYFMLQHNTRPYTRFLRLIACLRVHHVVCCCFRGIVDEQLRDLNLENLEAVLMALEANAHAAQNGSTEHRSGSNASSNSQISVSIGSQVSETNSAKEKEEEEEGETKNSTDRKPEFTITYANCDQKEGVPEREREAKDIVAVDM